MRAAAFALILIAQGAWAGAPTTSLRPEARPEARPESRTESRLDTPAPIGRVTTLGEGLAQLARRSPGPVQPPRPGLVLVPRSVPGVVRSIRPQPRPENLQRRTIVRRAGFPASRAPASGSVCGDRAIQGVQIAAIPGRIGGCGVADPVQIREVSGIRLSQPATMDCTTARALKTWVDGSVKPTIGRLGGGVTGLRVAAHYACRTRNNRPGARISEHGRGRAIDISAIQLANGVEITVLKGWRDRQHGRLLRQMHRAACGPFGTVLGPEADRFHQDHFHFDTARYRSGPYCR